MGHSIHCRARRFGTDCNCGLDAPLAPWEVELITGNRPVTSQIDDRIDELNDEIDALHMIIGRATVMGSNCEDEVSRVKEIMGRVAELKNVLKMMEV